MAPVLEFTVNFPSLFPAVILYVSELPVSFSILLTLATDAPVLAPSLSVVLAKEVIKLARSTSVTFKVKVCDVVVVPSLAVKVKVWEVLVSKSKLLAKVTAPVEELTANLLSASVRE